MITQISREESFEVFVFRKLRALKSIVLCEGLTEKLVIEKLAMKLGVEVDPAIGLVECGGIPHIYSYVSIITLLASIARKVRKLGVVIDGEDMVPRQRVESLVNALKARGITVEGSTRVDSQLYRIRCSYPRPLEIYVAINGVYSYPFAKHTIHDHGLLLALKMGVVDHDRAIRAKSAEEIVDGDELLELINRANTKQLKECFSHLLTLLTMMKDA